MSTLIARPALTLLAFLMYMAQAPVLCWADEPGETVPVGRKPVQTVDGRKRQISHGVIRGIHLTGAAAASKRYRQKLDQMFDETVVNAVIIDVKEETGFVYIPGVKPAERIGAYQPMMKDWEEWLKSLKERGIYTAARMVVNKDNIFPRKTPSAAVKTQYGEPWFDRTKTTWIDPYSDEGQTYNLLIALEAAKLGFDEIQFDYIRFPTDGNLGIMRFTRPFSRASSSEALVGFLKKARQLLHPLNVKISIDVFGLTTSVHTGMGIGQLMGPMSEQVDYVCPMVYPSHYNPGEYGLKNPNDSPYHTIFYAMRDAKRILGEGAEKKLRPYLQDFSLKGRGKPYRTPEVQDQIQASVDQGIPAWTLWNARCNYTWDAIRSNPEPSKSPRIETSAAETPVRSNDDKK